MVDKNVNNPLDELFTDSGSQIEPSEITALLKPFLRINRENKRILLTPDGMDLSSNKKIILFILARKAMHMRGVVDSESIAPKDIKKELENNIPAGTIDSALKRLSEKGPLKSQDGKYFIPDFNFPQVKEIFSNINK